MRIVASVLIMLGCVSCNAAKNDGYTLTTAPWSDESFQICPVLTESGLRPVLFKPEIENWTYIKKSPPTTSIKVSGTGVQEILSKNDRELSAYHLKEQKIGFLTANEIWVNRNGEPIKSFDQFEKKTGGKFEPTVTSSAERLIAKSDFKSETALALDKIKNAPPCSMFTKSHYDLVGADYTYDFGQNNPYKCDMELGYSQSTELNYTETKTRRIVSAPDSSNYYLKFPDGELQVYRAHFPIRQVTHNEQGKPICPWFTLQN